LRQEHRTHGRPCDEHCGNCSLHYRRTSNSRSAAKGRHHNHRRVAHRRLATTDLCMKARILIVEDEEPLTMLLRYNLEAEGYEVETSGRGDEAATRPKESTPALLMLHWMLAG